MDYMKKTIGIADADLKTLKKTRKGIEGLGDSVLASQSGSDILALFRNGALSILIADTELKDMSGLDLVCTIKEVDSSLPIIVTTKDYSKNLEIECRKMGIVFYARKPLNLDAIRWMVARQLQAIHDECGVACLKESGRS
jgi:DNA-binding NtrC family response regulator